MAPEDHRLICYEQDDDGNGDGKEIMKLRSSSCSVDNCCS